MSEAKTEKKPVVRTNPFVDGESRAYKLYQNGLSILEWLAVQPDKTTRAPNHVIADTIGVSLDPNRSQSRRLGEAFEALRFAGLVETEYETPHPRKNPTGRVVSLTAAGEQLVRPKEEGKADA